MFFQSRLPDQINLWVSKQPYLRDSGITRDKDIDDFLESLPEANRNLVSVRWVENTGPYRKLIPMLREAGDNDIIVTADDDIFYGRNWLSGLLTAFEMSGERPVAARVRSKRINVLGKYMSYMYWPMITDDCLISKDYVVTFGGGAVLKKRMFRDVDVMDDSYLKVAPTADDLWYSRLLINNVNALVVVPNLLKELNFIKHKDGLKGNNWPNAASFLRAVKLRVWDKPAGLLGYPISGNDVAYAQINQYFKSQL